MDLSKPAGLACRSCSHASPYAILSVIGSMWVTGQKMMVTALKQDPKLQQWLMNPGSSIAILPGDVSYYTVS